LLLLLWAAGLAEETADETDEPEEEEPTTGPPTISGRRCDVTKELLSGDAEFISNFVEIQRRKCQ
jgi:hypothetical protein